MILRKKFFRCLLLNIGGIVFLAVSIAAWFNGMTPRNTLIGTLLIGVILTISGLQVMRNRVRDTITINSDGITQRDGKYTYHVPAAKIEYIKAFADFHGRGVLVKIIGQPEIRYHCRIYCSPHDFVNYCKAAGLPCA